MSDSVERGRPPTRSLLVQMAAFVIVTAGLRAASDLVLLILAALFIAIAVAPPIFYLQKKGVPFNLGLVIVLATVIGALVGMGGLIGTSVTQLRNRLPIYDRMIRGHYQSVTSWLQEFGIEIEFETLLGDLVDPARTLDLAGQLFAGVGGVLTNGFLIFILVLFLLLEASTLPEKVRVAFGDRGVHLNQFQQLFTSINSYLVMKTWLSLVTGLLAGILCGIVGVDFPVLWGLLAFLLNYVPNVGSIVAAIPPTLLALLQMGGGSAVVVVVGYVVINNVLGNIVEPRVMGQGLGLSPFVVLLSLVFWGWVLGPVGMLLSIPLTIAVKIAMESGEETRWIAVLLGSGDAESSPAADAVEES